MHEKRKKYYHIRKDLFWCTILLAISFLIGYAIHHRIFLTHSLKADAPKERDHRDLHSFPTRRSSDLNQA